MITRGRLFIVIGLLTASFAAAKPTGFGGRDGFDGIPVERMKAKLGLTDAQADQIRAIQDRHVRARIELDGKIEYARHGVKELVHSDSPDRSAIHTRVDEIARLTADKFKLGIDALLDTRAILTPEQRERVEQLRSDMRSRRMEGRKGRGGRGNSHAAADDEGDFDERDNH